MKIASALISSLLFSLTAASSVAYADGANAFIEGTLQGNWQPAVTSVSNETPHVGKSLDLFLNSALGKTPRITPAVIDESKPGKTDTAEIFTSRFQNQYRHSKS